MQHLTRFQMLEVVENWKNGIHIASDGAVYKLEDLTPQFLLLLLTEFGGRVDTTIIFNLVMDIINKGKKPCQKTKRK